MASDELLLLERVFLRIGSAESDDQLEATLSKFLPPVLLKLASEAVVRKKVMELLVHVNRRVKSRPAIQLPIDDLLVQYLNSSVQPFVTNFTILYIKMGFRRLPVTQQVALLPQLLRCLEGRPEPQQNSIMQLFIPTLQHVTMPSNSEQRNTMFDFAQKPVLTKMILGFMMDVLLLQYNMEEKAGSSEGRGPPAGMSDASLRRVTSDGRPAPDDLEKIKLGILKFLGSDIFKETEVACHFVVSTADVRHSVASAGDRELKKIVGGQDWNNHAVITKLYSLFQGTVLLKGQASTFKAENKLAAGSIQLRLRIFPFLLKSKEAANQFPSCIQIVFGCLYGDNTNAKLKVMALKFVQHLCVSCTDGKFQQIGGVLFSGMTKLASEAQDDAKLRCLAYTCVGQIAARLPLLVSRDIGLLQQLFETVTTETDAEARLALQATLSTVAAAITGGRHLDAANARLMETLIMHNIEMEERDARLLAVQFAVSVFPSDHMPSRYALLLACGDRQDDIYKAASSALRTVVRPDQVGEEGQKPPPPAPPFPDMVKYISEKATQRLKTPQKYVIGDSTLAFNPSTYGEILLYLRMILARHAGARPALETTDAMREQAPLIGRCLQRLLAADASDAGPVALYVAIIRQVLTASPGEPALYCLLETVAVARDTFAGRFLKHLDWIKKFMFHTRDEMRKPAAELYALVVATAAPPADKVANIKRLIGSLQKQAVEAQHGCLLCLGYLLEYQLRSERLASKSDTQLQAAMAEAVTQIAGFLDSSHALLSMGACTALGRVGLTGALPLPDAGGELSKQSIVENLVKKVQTSSNSSKLRQSAALTLGYLCVGEADFPHKKVVVEGLLKSAAAQQFDLHLVIGEALLCCAEGVKSPAGRDPWLVAENLGQPEDADMSSGGVASGGGASEDDGVASLVTQLLDTYTVSANPHIRQAACVWLLTVVKKCSEYSAVQSRVEQIQRTFMNLLAEDSEITQDIASKGLATVYEHCSADLKDTLVSLLVETLTGGQRRTQEVTSDTKVFQTGALGKTPDGKNMSTYKELCSIATDLNQPDLIYKFMHLANHQAVWNSKKGAAFGFSAVVGLAGHQLAPHMHRIVPKLFRYQFDPNPKIRVAMSGIWDVLVKDNKKTVDKYLVEIIEDLKKNLTSREWRVRESSCLALNDALRGRVLDDIVLQLPELWETCLRVLDDIKESVRNAADVACKSLSRASIKVCNPQYGAAGVEATRVVLPCLLRMGLGSSVKEVRAISLTTIVKISRSAGELLKPHIAPLLTALLESLSGLEPQMFNYLSLHAASNADGQLKLDAARLAVTKSSPMMEVINLCIPFVDEAILVELIPRLIDLLKNSVGLGTKAGSADVVVSLLHHCPRLLEPYAGKLLAALLNGLADRNATVKKTYASTIGYLVKVAKDSSVEKLLLRLKDWYLQKDDEALRQACGMTLKAINDRSADILRRHSAVALPLAFLAMHRTSDENTSDSDSMSPWEEVWLDATPGTEAGIRLFASELVALSATVLQSQSWRSKAQAAAAMSTIGAQAGLPTHHQAALLAALLAGLRGRTWPGKECLLKAISSVSVSCRAAFTSTTDEVSTTAGKSPTDEMAVTDETAVTDEMAVTADVLPADNPSSDVTMSPSDELSPSPPADDESPPADDASPPADASPPTEMPPIARVVDAVMSECRRQDVAYRRHAIRCLSEILAVHDVDRFPDVFKLLQPLLSEKEDEDDDRDEKTWSELEECAYECMGRAWPSTVHTQDEYRAPFFDLLCGALSTSPWKVEVAALKAMKLFLGKLHLLDGPEPSVEESRAIVLGELTAKLVAPICLCLGNLKYGAVGAGALDIAEVMLGKLRGYLSAEQEKTLKAALDGMLEHKNISTVARRLAEQLLKL